MLPRVSQKKKNRKAVTTVLFVVAAFLFLGLFFATHPVFAETTGDTFGLTSVDENISLGNQDIRVIIGKIIRAVLGFLGALLVVIIMYGGFVYMTAGGNEEKITQARKILINSVIGLAIIMSAFAIAHFVITQLQGAINPSGTSTVKAPVDETFSGSAGLGKVVRDHYPFRDETGVKRNTKVVVTFVEAIDPSTIVDNTNNTCVGVTGDPVACDGQNSEPYFGDCNTNAVDFSFLTDCDQLKSDAIQVFRSSEADSDTKTLVQGSAAVLYEDGDERNAYTFVFRPHEYLGADGEIIRYTVILDDSIEKKNGFGLFEKQAGPPFYKWDFETDGELDLSAPFITDVNPGDESLLARNEYVQINFNEEIDPTMVQGQVDNVKEAAHIKFNTSVKPQGEWKITNGYKTVEFHSSEQCGVNSCGEPLYCMPVSCEVGECNTDYGILVKTAALVNPNLFESIPFSGVMDMAGNALDGDGNGVPDGKPPGQTFEAQAIADNYYWNFAFKNEIDRSAPYIEHILPAIDKEQVIGQEPVRLRFNRRMLMSSIDSTTLLVEEYPEAVTPEGIAVEFWAKPDSDNEGFLESNVVNTKTVTKVLHREFGPNGDDFYYFPQITNSVRASNGNCMHPGRGPYGEKGVAPTCKYSVAANGEVTANASCVPVTTKNTSGAFDGSKDTGCVIDINLGEEFATKPDLATCLTDLKDSGISPL